MFECQVISSAAPCNRTNLGHTVARFRNIGTIAAIILSGMLPRPLDCDYNNATGRCSSSSGRYPRIRVFAVPDSFVVHEFRCCRTDSRGAHLSANPKTMSLLVRYRLSDGVFLELLETTPAGMEVHGTSSPIQNLD